jgi:hypothetical protein
VDEDVAVASAAAMATPRTEERVKDRLLCRAVQQLLLLVTEEGGPRN